MPTSERSSGWTWGRVALFGLGAAGVALLLVVFLVLTGIIAEPETVIEQIFRMLIGG